MKKLIVLCSMIIALGFVATGCGGGDSGPASAPAPAPEATQPDDSADTGGAADTDASEDE